MPIKIIIKCLPPLDKKCLIKNKKKLKGQDKILNIYYGLMNRTIVVLLITVLWGLFSFRLFPILMEKLFNIDKEVIIEEHIHVIVWFSPIGVLLINKLLSYIINGGSLLLSILIIIVLLGVIIRKVCK